MNTSISHRSLDRQSFQPPGAPKPEFEIRQSARFLKDLSISPQARFLDTTLRAHADGQTGEAFIDTKRLGALLGCGRDLRLRAQQELVALGRLRLERRRGASGRFSRIVYVVAAAGSTVDHSRSARRSTRSAVSTHLPPPSRKYHWEVTSKNHRPQPKPSDRVFLNRHAREEQVRRELHVGEGPEGGIIKPEALERLRVRTPVSRRPATTGG